MLANLTTDEKDAIKILDYWFIMEFLNQQSLKKYKEKETSALTYKKQLLEGRKKRPNKKVEDFVWFKPGDTLRTLVKAESEAMRLPVWSDFTVFVGCMRKEVCIQNIAQNVEWAGQGPEENYDEIALVSLKFSKDGSYVADSLSISPLAWAMKRLSGGTANASQKLAVSEYNSEVRELEDQISRLFEPIEEGEPASESKESCAVSDTVSYGLLKQIENMVLEALHLNVSETRGSFLTVYFKLYASENEIEEEENEIGLHMDFYSEDLAMAADGIRNHSFTEGKKKLLLDYILGLYRYGIDSEKKSHRFDVVKPQKEEELYQFMRDILTAKRAPLGKWPSRFMPVLMQQIAVNLATDEAAKLPVFSVNGPPGTGKTTLLKEIIVSNIIEKARLLAEYADPDEAFDDYSFQHGNGPGNSYNQWVKKYHRLKNKKISGYSILVASSNNTAVENITKELPLEEKIIGDLASSEKNDGPNDAALDELTGLFTVSESRETLPFKQKIWEEYTNEKGEKKARLKEIVMDEPDIYFSRFATDLLNDEIGKQEKQQAFGLISASLGKKANIDKVEKNVIVPLLEVMKRNDDVIKRKRTYLTARERFCSQLSFVLDLRAKLDQLSDQEKEFTNVSKRAGEKKHQAEIQRKKQTQQLSELDRTVAKQQENIGRLNDEKKKLETKITGIRVVCADLENKIALQRENIAAAQTRIDTLQKSVSLFGKLFKSSRYKEAQEGITQASAMQEQYLLQMNELNQELNDENGKLPAFQDEIGSLETEIYENGRKLKEFQAKRAAIEAERQRLETELAAADKKVKEQKKLLEKAKLSYQSRDSYERGFVLERQFIKDVLSSDMDVSTKAQLRNPWISEHYNREREKLFLYALQMTKEFILGSNKCRDNFKHLDCLWSGSYGDADPVRFVDDDLQACTTAVYETLFLLIPVVSSTFASVQRLLKNVKEDIIGTLIVDEAGQASPHMAIGALCRAGKAVIVGDPKQVEPVVTDDQDVLKQTYTEDMFKLYADKTNSVQRFADLMNPYGTYLENDQGAQEWVGCPLLVHRRCIAPMYDISNDISYNNIMKQQTAQPKAEKLATFIAAQSQWMNISGKEAGRKRHFVKEQGDKVIEMLETAFSKNPSPDLFIISPFATVVSGIKDYVKKYAKACQNNHRESVLLKYEPSLSGWLDKNVGTVHRFQGKEAAEVIFLLGCDTSSNAGPAIRWVSNNIVNVAATRAKYRLYVIGDIQAWKQSKCVSRAKEIIDTYAFESLDRELQKAQPDQEKLKHLCLQIPGGTTFPVQHEQGESEEEEEYIPSTEEVIGELSRSSVMSRKLTQEELSRFGFSSMEEISKFGSKIQSNLIWGMKLYLLLERAYKQTTAEIDASCCGILFCKAIEARMQECFADALKHYFPDYQMRAMRTAGSPDQRVRYLKDASPEEFTLGWYPTFIKHKKNNLGSIMAQLGYTAYDRQWWDDFQAKLFECKNRRNDCCHTKLFRWENLETLLKTIFAASESEHHNRIDGLIYESKVGLLMKEGER